MHKVEIQVDFIADIGLAAWRQECQRMFDASYPGCGLSLEVFVARLSAAIDERLAQIPVADRDNAIAIAEQFGYQTMAERNEDAASNAEHGDCCHGIAWGCCPAGCGSGYDD